MAGKPGMKGGGGARPGAGRKPKEKQVLDLSSIMADALTHKDPKAFLLAVMNDGATEARLRVDAAKALMPFIHQKIGEGGKKDEQQNAAKRAGAGKFSAAAPPRLVSSRGS